MADIIKKINLNNTDYPIDRTFSLMSASSVAGSSSKPYLSVRWYVSDVDGITTPYDGMRIAIKIPRVGVSTAGVVLSINGNNDADYHPVLYNSSLLTSHYGANSVKFLVYDANSSAGTYVNSGNSAVTVQGVWRCDADYDSTNIYQLKTNYARTLGQSTGDSTATKSLYRYQFLMEDLTGKLIPFGFTNNAPSTYTKALSTASFNPFSDIFIYVRTSSEVVAVGGSIAAGYLYQQYLCDLRYSFNINSSGTAGSTALTANKPVYIKMLYNHSTMSATFVQNVSSSNYLERSSLVQDLPTTNPNTSLTSGTEYIYIQLGNAYDLYRVDMLAFKKNIYHWNNTDEVCCLFDGNNIGVTSVDLSMPTGFTVSGNPITSSGTFNVALASGYELLNSNSAQTIAGEKMFTSAITLYNSSNGDTPMLIFRRGTLTDNYNDWGFVDSGGYLYLKQRGSGSSDWSDNRVIFTQTYTDIKGAIYENGTALGSKYLCFTDSQSLTNTQKSNARTNIGIVTNSTYDETNNKIATMNDLLDTNVKLSSELKTYYNVGKITNASGTNPVTIGNQGDSLRTVFNNLFNMDEIQPTITSNPSITTLSLSSSASDERGTSISSISYSISTSQGSYTYQPNPTGVSWSSFNLSGSGITPISGTTSKTGTITLSSAYVVGTSSAISVSCEGSYTQGNIAKTNLGNDSNPIVRIAAGTASKTGSFSKTAVDYPYYGFGSSSSTAPSTKEKGSTSLQSTTGQQLTYTSGNYVWIFSKTNNSNLKIMIYSDITQDWSEMLGGTTAMGSITFTKQNGVSDTFYGYRTVNTAVSGATAKIRLTTS